ncbi:MAG: hypothetical protein AVDCRST_MAG87-3793 [uncultured Thermomicrobiales bacterium]|uniref:Uncharacterized protein n=1 Tax=uncultured Thermomicrobiales bacterium TaxID=1645740 RepID=A0A6J4VQG2_9BACT|nr:MAG: hypothetical protein AVDCRST_MAG87-3793 [uncultured Thermomicrobiales bacterium]
MIVESTCAAEQGRLNVERVTALLKGVMASVQKVLGGRGQSQNQGQKKK